jgi:hypothetical protein
MNYAKMTDAELEAELIKQSDIRVAARAAQVEITAEQNRRAVHVAVEKKLASLSPEERTLMQQKLQSVGLAEPATK